MKIGALTKQETRHATFPEGLLADAIKSHIKKSKFPKRLILRQLELLLNKYQDKQEQFAKRIIEVKEGNDDVHADIERLRRKNSEIVIELRGKLS